ncbi:MAG: acyl-CoA dehydrogenase [Alphaproteobacteria bacterium]|nr:MAG: acyl-CoA dehydrogenase [Alphaproteobacteria bacterium]
MLKRTVYDEDHELFRDAVKGFFARELEPHYEQWEKDHIVPREFWLKAGEQGLLCPQIPEEYGGPGGDYRYLSVVVEELHLAGATGPGFAVHSDICSGYILSQGSEEQKKHWLPKMVSGEAIAAIAMTEPGTGSDLQGIRTTARRDGDDYVINGAKTFVSNGQNANVVIVVAKTDPSLGAKGISLILVETDREGFRCGRNLEKMGLHAQDTSEMFFDDVRVPVSNLMGQEGGGFGQLMNELPQERLAIAVGCQALAQRAYNLTVEYTRERQAFGKPIIEFQNTRFKLADMKTQIEAGWAFVDKCIEHHRVGELDATDAAMVKLWTSEMLASVADECVQLFGGYGYMMEYPITRTYLDARVQRIFGGTSEIMKELISRSL